MNALLSLTRPLVFGAAAVSRAALVGAAVWLAAGSLPAAARAQIVVNSPEDIIVLTMPGQPPACTLRDAILAANHNQAVGGCAAGVSSASPDTITFNLSFNMSRIRVRDQLPPITEPVIINGGSGGPISLGPARVELDGTLASQAASLRGERAHGLYLAAGDSTIRNLVINNFNGNGIVMTTLSAPPPGDFTPPTITDPSLPAPIPCHARPSEPECPPGDGGGLPPDQPPLGGAGARNRVVGCFIGTDASGKIAMGNGSGPDTAGIVTDTIQHTIGGTTEAERNVISGNWGHGLILGGRAHDVRGNFIGLGVTGAPLGNQFDGINVAGGQLPNAFGRIGATSRATDTQCGPAAGAGCGNRIAYNGRNGISAGYGEYEILSNEIFDNAGLGIDVNDWGLTLNDPGRSRNFPEWISKKRVTGGVVITGQVTNFRNPPVTVQIFQNDSCDPSKHGEGQTLIETISLPLNKPFSIFVPWWRFGYLTATATTTLGVPTTSEFSACLKL